MTLRVEFIGRDGSLGYRTGRTYDLHVRTDRDGEIPQIVAPQPCPYASWAAFWRNWRMSQ